MVRFRGFPDNSDSKIFRDSMRDKLVRLVRGSPSSRVTAVIGKPRRYPPVDFAVPITAINRSPDHPIGPPPGGVPFVAIRPHSSPGDITMYPHFLVGIGGDCRHSRSDDTRVAQPGVPDKPGFGLLGWRRSRLCASGFPITAT